MQFDGLYEGVAPGHGYTHTIGYDRAMMHAAGIIPKVVFDQKASEIRRIVAKCDGGDCIVSQVDPESMEAIKQLLGTFKIAYAGQSLPAAAQTVLFKLMEPKREHLTEKERAELLEQQCGQCSAQPGVGAHPALVSE